MSENNQKKGSLLPLYLIGGIIVVCSLMYFAVMNGGDNEPRPTRRPDSTSIKGVLQEAIDRKAGATGTVSTASLGNGVLFASWQLGDNITDNLVRDAAKNDIVAILQAVKNLNREYETVELSGYIDLIDAGGNTSNQKVIDVTYSRDTIENINFNLFNPDNVYIVADSVDNHPLIQDQN